MKLKQTNFEAVREFMVACDQKVKSTPAFPDQDTMDLRLSLIEEEFGELSLDEIKANPFLLQGKIKGLGFKTLDKARYRLKLPLH